jgi:cytochrome c oxidase subunit 4
MDLVDEERKEVSLAATLATGGAVIALWIASWGISYADLGAWNLAVALGIATVKAALVILVFMEIVVERTSVHTALAAGIAMIAILFVFMIADVRTRETPPLEPTTAGRSPS